MRPVLVQNLYAVLRGLFSLIAPDALTKELLAENMMLRHRLTVQTRNKRCPRLRIRAAGNPMSAGGSEASMSM
jgi:hypothetical protein